MQLMTRIFSNSLSFTNYFMLYLMCFDFLENHCQGHDLWFDTEKKKQLIHNIVLQLMSKIYVILNKVALIPYFIINNHTMMMTSKKLKFLGCNTIICKQTRTWTMLCSKMWHGVIW
jgi:hypothetical protein